MTSLAELGQLFDALSEQRAHAESTFLNTDDISQNEWKLQELNQLREEQQCVEAEIWRVVAKATGTAPTPAPVTATAGQSRGALARLPSAGGHTPGPARSGSGSGPQTRGFPAHTAAAPVMTQKPDPAAKSPSPVQRTTPPGDPEPVKGLGQASSFSHVRSNDSDSADDARHGTGPRLSEPNNGQVGEGAHVRSRDSSAGALLGAWPEFPAQGRLDAAGALSAVHDAWAAVFAGVVPRHIAAPWASPHENAHTLEFQQLRLACSPLCLSRWEGQSPGTWLKELHLQAGSQLPLLTAVIASSLAQYILGQDVSVLHHGAAVGAQAAACRTVEGARVLFSNQFHLIGAAVQAAWSRDSEESRQALSEGVIDENDMRDLTYITDRHPVLGDRFELPTSRRGVRFYRRDADDRIYIWTHEGRCDVSWADTWYPAPNKQFIPSPLRLAAAVALFLVCFYDKSVCFVHDGHAHDAVVCDGDPSGATSVLLLRTSHTVVALPTPRSTTSSRFEPTDSYPQRGAVPLTSLVQTWREEVELASMLESAVAALRRSEWTTKAIARAAGYSGRNGARDIEAMLHLRCKQPSRRLEQLLRAVAALGSGEQPAFPDEGQEPEPSGDGQ